MHGKMKWNTGLIFGLVFLLALTPWAWAGGKAAKNGDTVDIQYVGKFEDGSVFDKSEKGQPLSFELGTPRIIPGMNKAVEGMKVGESKTVTIPPAEAYGDYDEKLVQKVPRTVLPPDIKVGSGLGNNRGQMFVVKEVQDDYALLDANHRLAGKTLVFDIELVSIH